jgi:hypothetical protein
MWWDYFEEEKTSLQNKFWKTQRLDPHLEVVETKCGFDSIISWFCFTYFILNINLYLKKIL